MRAQNSVMLVILYTGLEAIIYYFRLAIDYISHIVFRLTKVLRPESSYTQSLTLHLKIQSWSSTKANLQNFIVIPRWCRPEESDPLASRISWHHL